MGQITSSVGLLSGIPIADTVDQLIAISGRPRDQLVNRTSQLQSQQVAIAQLTSLVLGLKLSIDRLGEASLFDSKVATSSDPAALSVAVDQDANPAVGASQYTPVRKAQAHQLLGSPFASLTDPIGAGSVSFQFGGFVDTTTELSLLNGGAGVTRGQIKITDRDGASDTIDLRYVQTVEDVVSAINASNDISIVASTSGDKIRLTDTTSGGGGITVEEVSGGSTAADLGLLSIDGVDTSATVAGDDVLALYNALKLSQINDGAGVGFRSEVDDLVVTFRDGSADLNIDLHAPRNATATTDPVSGVNAGLTFDAVQTGETYDGVTVLFKDNTTITKGNETVDYDSDAKTLTFNIDFGATDANDIVAALAGDVTASLLFTATAGGDGSGLIDLTDTAVTTGGATLDPLKTTLNDVLAVLNAADPARLQAAISGDGDHIELTDLTSGGGSFTVTSAVGGTVAEDLGLTGAAVGGVITSERLLAGLQTTLLGSLSGGAGLGTLGDLDLTDRSGATDTVDLSAAETLDDVITLINAASVGITARVNDARNGILLQDTTGAAASNLIVANGDATNSADKLGVTLDAAQTSINGGALNRHTVSRQTLLSSLNRGQGVDLGQIVITDSTGVANAVDLDPSSGALTTVGEVIDAINALTTVGVTASINETGDGVLLTDTAGGSGTLSVREVGSGTAAADLGILGDAVNTLVEGVPTQRIDGSSRAEIDITAQDSLTDLIDRINALDAGFAAGSFFDGQNYRLTISSDETGRANELLFDTSGAGFTFQETASARDALLLFGTPQTAALGLLVSSSDNTFEGIATGVDLTINEATLEPVSITVETTSDDFVAEVNSFVKAYNNLRGTLEDLTFFNEADETTGILFGSNETLRVDVELSRLLTGSFFGVGDYESLEGIGVRFSDDGTISLDEDALQDAYESDSSSIENLFTHETLGVSAKFAALIEQLAGEDNSLLINRTEALTRKIDENNDRIEFMNGRLEVERQRLLASFLQMEIAIGQFQSNVTLLSSIQPLEPLISTSN